MSTLFFAFVAAMLAAPACRHQTGIAGRTDQAAAATRKGSLPALKLWELQPLFGNTPASAPPKQPTQTPKEYREWVAKNLKEREFYDSFHRFLFAYTIDPGVPVNLVRRPPLQQEKSTDGKDFYYLDTPCAKSSLVQVKPWWDASKLVWVCKRDYKPNVLTTNDGQSCDKSTDTAILPDCGCGPHLMFCGTEKHARELYQATHDEISLTLQHIVNSDLPFDSIFTIRETVRPAYAELYYSRLQFFATGVFPLPDLDRPPTLKARPEFATGGMLSTPYFAFVDSHRIHVFALWAEVLCSEMQGVGVDVHTLMKAVSDPNLRSNSHVELASTPGCESCHAALEYGQVAYSGWQNAFLGMHFVPNSVPAVEEGRLYLRNHKDFRTSGPPTLNWLGEAIAAQPEFSACVAKRTLEYVYEGQDVPRKIASVVTNRFSETRNFRLLVEDAVVGRSFGLMGLKQ